MPSTPRRKRFNRENRLRSAKTWIPNYRGKSLVHGYRKWYGVNMVCAITELEILGHEIDSDIKKQALVQEERKRKNAERRKAEKENSKTKNDVFNPDQDDNFFYIAGYTSGGAPFGVTWEEYERDIKEEQLMKQTINYNNKIFKPLTNTQNGETSEETIFHYKQEGSLLTATYSGGKIKCGHLIGVVDALGNIDMRYHQINSSNELMTGICKSRPEILPNGKLRLHETWEWTCGDHSKGTSIIEEV